MSTQRSTFRIVVLVSQFALCTTTSHAQEKRTSLREAGQRYGLDVGEINRRLPPGQRVVGIEPPLESEDYVLPPRLADRAETIERAPAGMPFLVIEQLDDATISRSADGTVSSGALPNSEALVFLQLSDSSFSFSTKAADAGTLEANQLILGNEYVPGVTPLTGFDFLVFNSNSGPSGPADMVAELWDGDPLGLVDVPCDSAGPIPGTARTYSDLQDASQGPCAVGMEGRLVAPCVGLHRLRCTFVNPILVDCDRVWLVWRPTAGCRIGWRLGGDPGVHGSPFDTPPQIGEVGAFTGRFDCGHLNRCWSVSNPGCANDTSGQNCGVCCDNGLPPNAGGSPCDHTDGTLECSQAAFCTDGVAELELVTVYPPGSGSYASFVASVFAQARVTLSIIPTGNGPNGAIDPGVTIVGNEIHLPSAGRTVFLEARIGDWDPDDTGVQLRVWTIDVDGAGYTTGRAGTLAPKLVPCGGDAECVSALGSGAKCEADLGTCSPAFVDSGRGGENRFVFTVPSFCGTLNDDFGLRAACVASSGLFEDDPVPFPVGGLYGATYVLNVPSDAQGTFTLDSTAPFSTYLVNQFNDRIPLIGSIPAKIHLPCVGAPLPSASGVARNRYLGFRPTPVGVETALRVTLENLPPPFDVYNGRILWVGPPRNVSELAGSSGNVATVFPAATLRCDPYFTDWHGRCVGIQCAGGLKQDAYCNNDADCGGELHVYHGLIVPGGRYSIQTFDAECAGVNAGFSAALAVSSTRWGDLVGPFSRGAWGGPDGRVNIVTDVTATLDKFRNGTTAPIKVRCDLTPATPDQIVDISDVTQTLNAFRSLPYPFAPSAWPCPP